MDGSEIATGVTLTSFTKTGLSGGNTYVFRVKARNIVGLSSYSTTISIIAGTIP